VHDQQQIRRIGGTGAALLLAWLIVAAAAAAGGCASARTTDPARTATEQFLLSQAAGEAVAQLSFDPLRGRRVYVDSTFFAASEQQFVLGELRARLLLSGVELMPTREEAEIVMEVRSGGVGIDRYDYLLGIPALQFSGFGDGTGAAGNIPLVTPELAIIKRIEQRGVASVAYVAYWRETGEVVANSGPFIGRTLRDDFWFFGIGPRSIGDIPPIEPPEETEEPKPEEPKRKERQPAEPSEDANLYPWI